MESCAHRNISACVQLFTLTFVCGGMRMLNTQVTTLFLSFRFVLLLLRVFWTSSFVRSKSFRRWINLVYYSWVWSFLLLIGEPWMIEVTTFSCLLRHPVSRHFSLLFSLLIFLVSQLCLHSTRKCFKLAVNKSCGVCALHSLFLLSLPSFSSTSPCDT